MGQTWKSGREDGGKMILKAKGNSSVLGRWGLVGC